MNRRYLLSSAGIHLAFLGMIFLLPWLNRSDYIMIDGFDYMGSGGGGDGRMGSGSAPRAETIGQVVPKPEEIPVPPKPAMPQKATSAEETWKVKDAKVEKVKEKKGPDEAPLERTEKAQEEKTNIIRRGVKTETAPGQGGFDFGSGGPGTGGDGKGPGIGIGFGPGEGGFGGFGSYLKILRQRIWGEWTQSAVYGGEQMCIVGLTVDRAGSVSDIRVETPSGNSFYDSVALRAVRNSSPLPPLPSNFPRDEQRFRIQFRLID